MRIVLTLPSTNATWGLAAGLFHCGGPEMLPALPGRDFCDQSNRSKSRTLCSASGTSANVFRASQWLSPRSGPIGTNCSVRYRLLWSQKTGEYQYEVSKRYSSEEIQVAAR